MHWPLPGAGLLACAAPPHPPQQPASAPCTLLVRPNSHTTSNQQQPSAPTGAAPAPSRGVTLGLSTVTTSGSGVRGPTLPVGSHSFMILTCRAYRSKPLSRPQQLTTSSSVATSIIGLMILVLSGSNMCPVVERCTLSASLKAAQIRKAPNQHPSNGRSRIPNNRAMSYRHPLLLHNQFTRACGTGASDFQARLEIESGTSPRSKENEAPVLNTTALSHTASALVPTFTICCPPLCPALLSACHVLAAGPNIQLCPNRWPVGLPDAA